MDMKQQMDELRATIEENATDEQKEQMRLAREQIELEQKNDKFILDLHQSLSETMPYMAPAKKIYSEKVWKRRRKHAAEVKASRRRNRG